MVGRSIAMVFCRTFSYWHDMGFGMCFVQSKQVWESSDLSTKPPPLVGVGCLIWGVLRGRPHWGYSPSPTPLHYKWGGLAWLHHFWSLCFWWKVYSPYLSLPPSVYLILNSILKYSPYFSLTLLLVLVSIVVVMDLFCILCVEEMHILSWGPRPGPLPCSSQIIVVRWVIFSLLPLVISIDISSVDFMFSVS